MGQQAHQEANSLYCAMVSFISLLVFPLGKAMNKYFLCSVQTKRFCCEPLLLRKPTLSVKAAAENAAWLAQLVERQSAVREVEGSSPRPDQHSGS